MTDFVVKKGLQVGGSTKLQLGTTSGNATLDLSSGNYFDYTPSANTTFTFSNAPASGTATGFALAVTGTNVVSGYDLANASYDSVSFSVSGQDGFPTSLAFNTTGTKMYIAGSLSDSVYQYSLSTAFDLSTASYDNVSFSVSGQEVEPSGIEFNGTGTKMFMIGRTDDRVYQYSLSTAFDLSTASYDNVSFSVAGQDSSPTSFAFNTTGTKMYMVGIISDSVYQYSLSTAFDLSTASYDSVSFSVAAEAGFPFGLTFDSEGSRMYVLNTSNLLIYQYSLSTAFDLSTASYDSVSFSVSGQDNQARDIAFNNDGTKMYMVGAGADTVFQYSTSSSTPATITYPTSVDWPAGTAPDAPAAGETDVLVFYTEDGGTTYYGFQAGDAMA